MYNPTKDGTQEKEMSLKIANASRKFNDKNNNNNNKSTFIHF